MKACFSLVLLIAAVGAYAAPCDKKDGKMMMAQGGKMNAQGGKMNAQGGEDAAGGGNLQQFTGAIGGVKAPAVTNVGGNRPFRVEGNANFDQLRNALVRSCDVQGNKCQNVFNSRPNNDKQGIAQGDCEAQANQCRSQAESSAASNGAAGATASTGAAANEANLVTGDKGDAGKGDAEKGDAGKGDAKEGGKQGANVESAAAGEGAASADGAVVASAADVSKADPKNSPIPLGQCNEVPVVNFGPGLDGRKANENSFVPFSKREFQHGSALNPDIIFEDICNKINDTCQSKDGFQQCVALRKQLAAVNDRTGAAADKFNAAFGVKTNFAAVPSSAKAN